MNTIFHVVGARPNFMKAAPLIAALDRTDGIRQRLVHTGQHYDHNMSKVFFEQLGMPVPDFDLEVGSGSHAVQTAEIMVRFEAIVMREKPDLLVVYGDVNSTIGTALVAAKLGIPIAHMEAGLRSFDKTMPEEINRILTDTISDLYFTPSIDGNQNLIHEGVDPAKIFMVGNVMIDTLVRLLPLAHPPAVEALPVEHALVTLHRPSNVDDPQMLTAIMHSLKKLSERVPILFPVHPRTRSRIKELGLEPDQSGGGLRLLEPAGYLEFIWLQQNAKFVLTDSGGIQEESTYLKVPCLTLRNNTERPITCTIGTNELVGQDIDKMELKAERILDGLRAESGVPDLWDGKAGERSAAIISDYVR